jgi:energy-coupling factor transport system ATP-binding protein
VKQVKAQKWQKNRRAQQRQKSRRTRQRQENRRAPQPTGRCRQERRLAMGIKVDDICFLYERGTAMQVNALDHISCEIPDNQFIGLIGHTGSGKSTFVQTLNGLLKVTSGHIYYNGEDIDGDKFDKKKLRSDVGLVFQYPEHQLFEVDVITDVMFGPRNLGMGDQEAKQRAVEALESVKMPKSLYTSSPFDLSGGQKRRAAIAGVLAMSPRILILDEPTAGLDPKGRDEILGLIAEMKRTLNMTIILVSHSMDDVARYVDRIMVMGGGKLLYDDDPVKVFRHVKELESLGLAAPQITYIMKLLKERGLDVNTDCLTVKEAAAEILAHRRELHV